MTRSPCALLLVALFAVCARADAARTTRRAAMHPTDLICEYLHDPLGIDTVRPRLSWKLLSDRRGEIQTAYQIHVAGSEAALRRGAADLWDSGRVTSADQLHIEYGGPALRSGQRCWWRVRAWDRDGAPSAWSEPAWWEMGLLEPGDWHGRWIGRTTDVNDRPAPLLRREFTLSARPNRARIYVCGLGYYKLNVNGVHINAGLDPGYTRYDRRDLYATCDVTSYLHPGPNAIGVMLGNGWYNVQTKAVWYFDRAPWRAAPKLLLELRVEYDNGRTETIVTDDTWRAATGPITFNSIYGGETYDARLERPGWDRAGYDDSSWQRAILVAPPGGRLSAEQMPTVRDLDLIEPVALTEPKPGVFVYDMGQEFAGHARLNLDVPAGTHVTLRYGERLHPDGTLDQSHIAVFVKQADPSQQFQQDDYTAKGGGHETWETHFAYHGFRWVEMTGYPGRPTLDTLHGCVTHTDVPSAGWFSCSDPLLNKIQHATRWSYVSNLESIPTDCPTREKNGWTGDAHLAAEQALMNFAPAAVYTKWMNDLADEQRPSGELPGIVPSSGWGYEWGNGPAWDSAYLLIPWYMYEYCGDKRILTDHYDGFRRYVDYLTTKADNGIVSIGLGDWVPWSTDTPVAVTSTGYYYRDALITARAAELLGKTDDAAHYRALAESIRHAFNARFVNAATGQVANGSQTALSCALYQDLLEPAVRPLTLRLLCAAVESHDGHIDTGILGAKYVLRALTDGGRADLAYRIAGQKTQPGWGWWIEQGATTLWETWKGDASLDHIMFGDISAWFYSAIAGIRPDPAAPGFHHFFVRPALVGVGGLIAASAHYDSARGRISTDWTVTHGKVRLSVEVPPNTHATVYVPAASPAAVTDARTPFAQAEGGVQFLRLEQGCAVFAVGSGSYVFESTP